jgi:hypothetical protein
MVRGMRSPRPNVPAAVAREPAAWTGEAARTVVAWCRREWPAVLLLLGLQLVAFSYLYFLPILTNHTFTSVWLYPYPSFKTLYEGRFLADAIIWAQGGSGVQAFQMFLATLVQGCNGLLLADLLEVRGRGRRLLLAALLCLYPAFLDYYSFSVDHLTFVLGDTLPLLGATAWVRARRPAVRVACAAACFAASLAVYQPKLGLIALLAGGALILRVTRPPDEHESPSAADFARETGSALLAVAGGVALYWLAMRATIVASDPFRTHVNSPAEAWHEARLSYGAVASHFSTGIDGLSRFGHRVVLALLAVGAAGVLWDAWQRSPRLVPAVAAVIALLPVAARATFLVNDQAWRGAGRISFTFGYALLLFVARALRMRWAGVLAATAVGWLLWCFAVHGSQVANYAAFKTQRDLWWIGRIAERVEAVRGGTSGAAVPLVVAGHYPELPPERFVRHLPPMGPHRVWPTVHLMTPTFEIYRQHDILNALLGGEAFRLPTEVELVRAKVSMAGRKAWPAEESVYVQDGTVVVLLEVPTGDTPMTWTSR